MSGVGMGDDGVPTEEGHYEVPIEDGRKIVFELKRVPVSFFRFDPPKPPKNRIKAWFWHRRQEWKLARHMRFNSIPLSWANHVVNAHARYWNRPRFWLLHKLGKHTYYCEEVFQCRRRKRSTGVVIKRAGSSAGSSTYTPGDAGDDETIPQASVSG